MKQNKKNGNKTETDKSKKEFSPLKQTITMNLIFWAFCLIMLFATWMWIGVGVGLIFFYGILALSFTFVSMFSYVFDLLTEKKITEEI